MAKREPNKKKLNEKAVRKEFATAEDIKGALSEEIIALHEVKRTLSEMLDTILSGVEGAVTVSEVLDGGAAFRFLSANRACADWTGIAVEDWLGKRPQDLLPPADAAAVTARYAEAVRKKHLIEYEEKLNFPNGEIWALTKVVPLVGANGKITRVVATSMDITTRKRAEEKSRRQTALLNNVNDNTTELIFMKDLQGRMTYCNRATLDVMGITLDEAAGSGNNVRFRNMDELEAIDAADRRVAETGETIIVEEPYTCADGVRRIFLSTKSPLRDETGKIIGVIGVSRDITSRKRVDEELAAQRRLYKSVTDNTTTALFIMDERQQCVFMNPAAEKLTGFKFEETRGRALHDVVHYLYPDGSPYPLAECPIDQAFPTSNQMQGEEVFVHKDGHFYDVGFTASPLKDEAGKTVGTVIEVQDITTRKQAERDALFLSDLSNLIRTSEDENELEIAACEMIGRYFGVKRCYLAEVDETADVWRVRNDFHSDLPSIVGEYHLSDYPPEIRDRLRTGELCVNEDTKLDPRSADFYETAYEPFGFRSHVDVPLKRDGRLSAALSVITDEPRRWQPREINLLETIAERLLLAIEKLRGEKALRESEAEFRTLANAVPQIVFVSDGTGKITYVNEKWTEFSGLNTEETATPEIVAEILHPEDRKAILGEWANAFEAGIKYEVEGRIQNCKTGEYHWFLMRSVPVRDEAGNVVQWFGTSTDITENKRFEQERERLLAQEKILRREAEQANRLKDEFLATVSHELRTPLNAILGWATMARKKESDAETISRSLEVIERSARNQNQIINDILDVSRIITGKLHLNLQPLRLSRIVAAAIDTVRPSLEAKQITLETTIEATPEAMFKGDGDRLQQIIWNLLSNAVKFTPAGGKIKVGLKYEDYQAVIVVSDNGIGIAPDFLPFVFDRFRQADSKKNRKYGGLGLGLAVVRHLTELHGGDVCVGSEGTDRGAEFTIRLPLKSKLEKSISDNFSNQKAALEKPALSLKGLRILAVDDDPDALELVKFILTDEGAGVVGVQSVEEAINIFEQDIFDLVISDIGMPERDGFELIEELQKRFKRLPVIALTAYAGDSDSRKILATGFSAFLAKPFDPAEFIEMVVGLTKNL